MLRMILKTYLLIVRNLNVSCEMRAWVLLFGVLYLLGCNSSDKKQQVVYEEEEVGEINDDLESVGKLRLSEYGFFEEPMKDLIPKGRVYPYEMNTPLFTDYAQKKRLIYLPENVKINFRIREVLDFPIGSILIKNFYYSAEQLGAYQGKIIETRLLIHEKNGWKALPYIWNDEQSDAFLVITGGEQSIDLTNVGKFQYKVPNMAQCKSCHEINGAIAPIGPSARQLNRHVNGPNQLTKLKELGVLVGLPNLQEVEKITNWEDETASLEDRARAYLEINCGHCHRPEGPGKNSGLDLTTFSASDHSLGIYKSPVAAGAGSGGYQYDIVPGNPEESILIYRMLSKDPGTMMPELGRSLVHKEGVALMKEWINSMK